MFGLLIDDCLFCFIFNFTEVQEVFDLFDFWDGRDGLIDAVKIGDLLRCVGLNPTIELIRRHGGTKKAGK